MDLCPSTTPQKAVFQQDKSAEEKTVTNSATPLRNKPHPGLNMAKIQINKLQVIRKKRG